MRVPLARQVGARDELDFAKRVALLCDGLILMRCWALQALESTCEQVELAAAGWAPGLGSIFASAASSYAAPIAAQCCNARMPAWRRLGDRPLALVHDGHIQ